MTNDSETEPSPTFEESLRFSCSQLAARIYGIRKGGSTYTYDDLRDARQKLLTDLSIASSASLIIRHLEGFIDVQLANNTHSPIDSNTKVTINLTSLKEMPIPAIVSEPIQIGSFKNPEWV